MEESAFKELKVGEGFLTIDGTFVKMNAFEAYSFGNRVMVSFSPDRIVQLSLEDDIKTCITQELSVMLPVMGNLARILYDRL